MSATGPANRKESVTIDKQPLLKDAPEIDETSEIDWNSWVNAAKRSRTARQLRADGNNNVFKVSFFSGRSVEAVEAKMVRNLNDATANKTSLLKIEHSLDERFGKVVGKAVFNQIFKSKVAAGRPISSLEVRLADKLGHSLSSQVMRLSAMSSKVAVEKEINQQFQETMKNDFSDLSDDDWYRLHCEFNHRLRLVETNISRSLNVEAEPKENDPFLMARMIAREINITGRFDTLKYENLKNKKIEEYIEILNLLNKIQKTRSILQESLGNPECEFGLLYENRMSDLKMLKALQKTEQKLTHMLAEAESKAMAFGELISIAKKNANPANRVHGKDAEDKFSPPQGAAIEQLIGVDDTDGIASHPLLTDADRQMVETLLAGKISEPPVDEDNKSVSSTASLDHLSEDELSLSPDEMAASRAYLESKNKITPANGVVEKAKKLSLESGSPEENRRSIAVILAQLGLKTNPTKGDGNCLFHAINRQLQSRYPDVNQMRQELAELAQAEANRTSGDRPPDLQAPLSSVQIRDLRARPTDDVPEGKNPLDLWGDIGLHGPYIARLTNRPVVCFSPNQGVVVYEKGKPERVEYKYEKDRIPPNSILVAYNGFNHYEAVSGIDDESLPPAGDETDAPKGISPTRASTVRTVPAVNLVKCPVEDLVPITREKVARLESWLTDSGADPDSLKVRQLIEVVKVCGPQGDMPLSSSAYIKAKDFLMMIFDKTTVNLSEQIDQVGKEVEGAGNKIESTRGGILFLQLRSAFGSAKAKDILKNFDKQPIKLKELILEFEEHSALANELPKLSKQEGSIQIYLAKALHEIRTQRQDPLKLAYKANNPPELLMPVINELQARLNSEKDKAAGCFSDQAAKSLLEALKVVRLSEGVANRHSLQKPVDLNGALLSAQTAVQDHEKSLEKNKASLQVYQEASQRYDQAGWVKKFYIKTFMGNPNAQDQIDNMLELAALIGEEENLLAELRVSEENAREYVELMKICKHRYPECMQRIETAKRNIDFLTLKP